jgi:predicted heme/steroid binding protein
MLKTILQRTTIGAIAATASCFGMVGVASAQSMYMPSWRQMSNYDVSNVTNKNMLSLANYNNQNSMSGNSYVSGNGSNHHKNHGDGDHDRDDQHKMYSAGYWWGGTVRTGNAYNDNKTAAYVVASNQYKPPANNPCNTGQSYNNEQQPSYQPSSQSDQYKPTYHTAMSYSKTTTNNTNALDITNHNTQNAQSGSAYVSHNGSVGDVSTGNAKNTNSTTIDATLTNNSQPSDNSSAMNMPMMHTVSHVVSTTNNSNSAVITNSSTQNARSGSVNVMGNGHVGDVSTGNASNSNMTDISVVLSNN